MTLHSMQFRQLHNKVNEHNVPATSGSIRAIVWAMYN